MGHCAKHLTAAQQNGAAHSYKTMYLATPRSVSRIAHLFSTKTACRSGRQVRLAARHAAYWREHGRRGPSETSLFGLPTSRPSSPGIPNATVLGLPLPIDLIEKALLPLPDTAILEHLFTDITGVQ
jgi:hypothetical protein